MQQTEESTSGVGAQLLSLHPSPGMTLAEVAHEARNMVATLGVYCDLLESPGVFAEPYRHYGSELKTVATVSRGVVDKLLTLCGTETPRESPLTDSTATDGPLPWPTTRSKTAQYWNEIPPTPIENLAWELQTNRNLLAALAGPSTTVTVDIVGGALAVRMNSEDLTRILVNLVKNSVEAMSGSGGRIQLVLRECPGGAEGETRLLLNVEDNGAGFASDALEHIFEPGYTTHSNGVAETAEPSQVLRRGLGLSITRSIIESAGGSIHAANRDPRGACIQIELPVCAA